MIVGRPIRSASTAITADSLLVPSRLQDPDQKVLWLGNKHVVQRLISRFLMQPRGDTGTWIVTVSHHWNLDRPDPR